MCTENLIRVDGVKESLKLASHPSAEWISRQLTEACGWKQGPRYLVRDRDSVYGNVFIRRLRAMGIRDRPTAPRSPWQNGYCERLIGSIRQECLDHIVVFGERHLRYLLRSYANYYNQTRTHLSLNKDLPVSRAVKTIGRIEAAGLRFRPVMMTSFAFIFGLFPLVIAQGAGAATRHAVGTPVFGGMIAASVFGIFVIPLFYITAEQLRGWRRSDTTK